MLPQAIISYHAWSETIRYQLPCLHPFLPCCPFRIGQTHFSSRVQFCIHKMGDVCCKPSDLTLGEFKEPLPVSQDSDLFDQPNKPESTFARRLHQEVQLPPRVQEKNRELGPFRYPSGSSTPKGQSLGAYRLNNGTVYKGEWRRGKLHGKGLYLLPNRTVIECITHDNQIRGQGRVIYPNGDYYEGAILNGKANGKGKYVEEGVTYTGHFENNLEHGEGMEKGEDYQFQGTFEKGVKVKGRLTWTANLQHFQYQGCFEDELFEGQGTLTTDSVRYVGQFKQGLKCGEGKEYYLTSNQHYDGKFEGGVKQGSGELVDDSSGRVIKQGTWLNDIFQQ